MILGPEHTYWDVIEFKFIVLFVTTVLAVYIGNWIYDKTKGKK